MKSEIFYILVGLLRTNDNETIVSALSFMSLLFTTENVNEVFEKTSLLQLMVKLLGTKDIEYINYVSDIFLTILNDK
jgi:hypothetical protein